MTTVVRLALAFTVFVALIGASAVAGTRVTVTTGGSAGFFGGAGGGGIPHPPTAAASPKAPDLITPQGGGPLLLSVQSSQRRLVVVRSADGRLLAMLVVGPREVVAVGVPAFGAILDVFGTDAVGIPVAPGLSLTIVTP